MRDALERGSAGGLPPLDDDALGRYGAHLAECHARSTLHSTVHERRFRIAGMTVSVRASGALLDDALSRSLRHLQIDDDFPAELRIHCWEGGGGGSAPDSPLGWYIKCSGIHKHALLASTLFDSRGEMTALSSARFATAFHTRPNCLSMLDRDQGNAYFWVDQATELPWFESASSFHKILSWWLAGRNRMMLHAAAVGRASGGVLLVGDSGAGKSSTALAAVSAGLGFAGDDYCVASSDPLPRVFSVYNSAKLKGAEDLERLAEFQPLVVNPSASSPEKHLMFLYPDRREQLISTFPLKWILIVKIKEQTECRLLPAGPQAALRAMTPSTIHQLPGVARENFRNMVHLVRQVPCLVLEVGCDHRRVAPLIESLLRRS